MRDIVQPIRSCANAGFVHFRPLRGIKHTVLRPSSTKSCERRACPRPFCTLNVVGRASSIRYEDARKQNLSSSVRYDESSRRDFVRLVRSCVIGDLVIVYPVRRINEVELCPSCMMSRERIACHRPSNTRNQAGGASSI